MNQSGRRTGSKWRKLLVRGLQAGVVLYVLICVGCAGFQRRLIYFPPVLSSEQVDQSARAVGLERWKNSSGQNIGMKRLAPRQPADGRVLIVYGNGSCAIGCARYADVIQQVAAFDVFIVEYPGYADRPGKPTEATLERAADEAFQLLATNGPVYLVGESLGTGVACYLAGTHSNAVTGVALLAPYNSLTDVAQYHMPFLPVHLILVDRFRSDEHLRSYHGPVAILVGGQDPVVPMRFGRRLYDGYTGLKRLWEFPEANHGTVTEQPSEVWKNIFIFLQEPRSPLEPK